MDDGDDFLGSLGLGKLLASEGVDASGLSSILSRGGGASASNELANVDNESDDDAKYEDDLSDHDLLPETEAEKTARAREKQEEARYRRMALQMNQELEAKRAIKGKGKAKEDPKDFVKRIWPDFEPGRRLRMTDVIYETPYAREQYKQASYKRKRQKVVHESIRMSLCSSAERLCLSIDTFAATRPKAEEDEGFLADLPPLRKSKPGQAPYETPLGGYFEREWIKGARDLQRKAMKQAPADIDFKALARSDWVAPEAKTLDLADWEKDIIMYSL
jgi:hypothetical protein